MFVLVLAGTAVRGDLVLTNYTAARPLKVMAVGDSITDDCSINGAWRLYLQPLLQTNGYAFTNVGRWVSTATGPFTETRHEGICGAVIGFPGMFGYHGYPTASNYALGTVADALTNTTPDLFLIDLGVNDMGYGRDPWFTATNELSALLDLMFARAPAAHIVVGKPTTISHASIGSPPYYTYSTNMPAFGAAIQSLVNLRHAQGQNVFVADLFSAVNGATMLQSDGTHPNPAGLIAMAGEWASRIAALTVRTDRVVTPFIAVGSTWKYSDQGLDLGTNWAQPSYDDSGWAEGVARLGYNTPGIATTISAGPVSTNKYITTYFRLTFVVPAGVHYTNLNLRINRADAVGVWLNGGEITRMNLPTGAISALTLASTVQTGDAPSTYFPTNLPIPYLPAGVNVLAVELHKFAPNFPWLSFDLELFGQGDYAPPVPPLTASLNGASVGLAWPAANGTGFVLLAGTNLAQTSAWSPVAGPYSLAGGSYEYTAPVNPTLPAEYYTLIYAGSSAPGSRVVQGPPSNAPEVPPSLSEK